MSDVPPLVAQEAAVLARVIPALRALQSAEGARESELRARLEALHREWTDARGDPAQREAFEEALAEAKRALDAHLAARKSRELPVGTPYFARLVLEEEEPRGGVRRQEVMLGKVGVVEGGLRIVDWRDAPVSQLYYQYEEGDDYAETIAGRAREGTLVARRRVDVRESVLVEVQGGDGHFRLRSDGAWVAPQKARAESDDHRLPDIVSLITREQFQVVTRPDAGVVLLRGRAGSGKTTVALHRIAWLHFQDPRRFRPERMLVVMFNKALQTYISRVLPELGVAGVPVETFHGWALRMLRSGQLAPEFRSVATPAVARLKRHPAMGRLLAAHVAALGEKSAAWVREQLGEADAAALDGARGGWSVIAAARRARPGGWWTRLRARLLDHPRDLYALFEDDALCRAALPEELHAALPAARANQARCAAEGCLDWQDAALLLRLGQLKRQADGELPCPWAGAYAHLVIDEAQDLSTVEIEALVDAADEGRCVTIAGDPAQKILADAQFQGFEALLRRLTGQVEVRLDALAVGHRSTRPIMALAVHALGQGPAGDPAVIAARDGEPVTWFEGAGAAAGAVEAVRAFRAARPHALVAVLAKGKAAADRWARQLEGAGLADVRRAARADFSFRPGVVVSNVHQVKGLEFDGVLLVEPADFGEPDRHLLHVAITRAADRLWVAAEKGRGVLAGAAVG